MALDDVLHEIRKTATRALEGGALDEQREDRRKALELDALTASNRWLRPVVLSAAKALDATSMGLQVDEYESPAGAYGVHVFGSRVVAARNLLALSFRHPAGPKNGSERARCVVVVAHEIGFERIWLFAGENADKVGFGPVLTRELSAATASALLEQALRHVTK